MTNERCLLWIGALTLIAFGFVFNQAAAVTVAAVIALYLVYDSSIAKEPRPSRLGPIEESLDGLP